LYHMKNSLIVANWKSNKTIPEANDWLAKLASGFTKKEGKEVVLCVSFPLLHFLREQISKSNLDIKLGAQDVSQFPEGPYTGEVNARQLKELADYVIIGHSERRERFGENKDTLFEKVKRATEQSLLPIFCVQNENTEVPDGQIIVAYEPPDAISTSSPDSAPEDPEEMENVAYGFKSQGPGLVFLYGGSVDQNNVREFTEKNSIDGVLVGAKSLSAEEFLGIYQNA